MKALCLVAHPDDCVIFGYSYIHNHPEMDWTICYLTYCEWDPRGRELQNFWRKRGIACVFLGYTDDYRDIENKQISFNQEQACREIGNIITPYDLVLTHNQNGEYGHLHHVFVHDCAREHPGLVTFADTNSGTVTHTVPPGTYDLAELPQHGDVIKTFFPDGMHRNNYTEVNK
jgi:LmbE family N-acetylglucosaminyl deacetylase